MQLGNETYLYHEKQDAALCGVHCLNSLLQGHYFTEVDLMMIAREMDEAERRVMMEMGTDTSEFLRYMAEESGNVADDGNYSIQVLAKALSVWGLIPIPITAPEMKKERENPLAEQAFICNLASHWLTIRKIGDDWYNLNSLQEQPQYLSQFYLSAFLDTLMAQGYTVFVVKGQLPRVIPDTSILSDKAWKKAPHRPASAAQHMGASDKELERILEQSELEAAIQASLGSPGTQAKRKPDNQQVVVVDDEDEELALALKMSQEVVSSQATTSAEKQTVASEPPKLPDLPAEPDSGPEVCELSIRFPDSSQVRRRFAKNAPLQLVFDFLAHKGYNMSQYSLISTYPPTTYTETTKSLDQYGLDRGAALVLRQKQ